MSDDGDHEELPADVRRDEDDGYLYRPGQLLVAGDPAEVNAVNRRLGRAPRGKPEEVASGVVVIPVDADADVPALVSDLRTPPTDVRGGDRPGLPVFPNHVLRGLGHFYVRPGGPPRPATAADAAPQPGTCQPTGVRIAVLDSGVDAGVAAGAWLSPFATGDDDSTTAPGGVLDRYCGHGTFIAGILRRHAPGAEIVVKRVFDGTGYVDDVQLAQALSALASAGVDVVSLSLGGYTADNLPCPATEAAIAALRANDVVIVAAAGNENTSRPSWPAAFKGVVAVGAVDANGDKACFSNYGSWVDACAEGVDVVSTFVHSPYPAAPHPATDGCPEVLPEPGGFEGFARWSGTSFAAPRVAAAIANDLARLKSRAHAVFSLLQGEAHPRRGLGVRVA